MAFFLTPVIAGVPKWADQPGAHWRQSPDGTQALLEFTGPRQAYAAAKADPETTELTRRQARTVARQWNQLRRSQG